MKGKIVLTSWISLLIIAGFLALFIWNKTMNNKPTYRLEEPMLIATSKGEPYYMIPANTVLHFKEGFAEGHQLYTIEVFYKGDLPAEQVSSSASIESTWLYRLDADDVAKVFKQYPLSKDDLIQILKARKMTRDDLAQIVREWQD